jgi:hypothetical protein
MDAYFPLKIWPLEKKHDLNRPFDLLPDRRSDLLPAVEPLCEALVKVYFTDRYPGFDLEDPDWPALFMQVRPDKHSHTKVERPGENQAMSCRIFVLTSCNFASFTLAAA